MLRGFVLNTRTQKHELDRCIITPVKDWFVKVLVGFGVSHINAIGRKISYLNVAHTLIDHLRWSFV